MKKFKVFGAVALALMLVAVIVAACNQTPPPLESQGLAPVRISNPVFMNQTLNVAGDTKLSGDLTVVGDITAASIVTDGNATLTSLSTTGNITALGTITADGYIGTYFTGTLMTANQSNVTNIGSQNYMTATNANLTRASTTYLTATGTISVGGQSTFNDSVYANAYLRASDGTVYVYDGFRVRLATKLDGALTVTGTATFLGFNIESTAIMTPTDGGTLTPTAKLVQLNPGGAIGIDLGACTSGQQTTLYNSVNANVVITDTGNGILAGNQTLGQYDALRLSCFDSKWVQESAVSAN